MIYIKKYENERVNCKFQMKKEVRKTLCCLMVLVPCHCKNYECGSNIISIAFHSELEFCKIYLLYYCYNVYVYVLFGSMNLRHSTKCERRSLNLFFLILLNLSSFRLKSQQLNKNCFSIFFFVLLF